VISAERAAALDFARGTLAQEIDLQPLDALLQSVRLAAGMATYHRIAIANGGGDHLAYERALSMQNRFAKTALDAGVAERQVRIAERMAERLVLAFEDAIADMKVTKAERQAAVKRYADGLARLEDPIDSTAEDA